MTCFKWCFCPSATTQHIIWRWDGSSSQWLLHAGGEGAPQGGMEALRRAEEKLWKGEKELHRSCYQTGARGNPASKVVPQSGSADVPHSRHAVDFHRKGLLRRTELPGSSISFWAWLPLQTAWDLPHQTVKVAFQLVSRASLYVSFVFIII